MAFTIMDQGTFTSDSLVKNIDLPSGCDYFVATNLTQMAANPNPGVGVKFEWYPSLNAGEAFAWTKTNSTNAINIDLITSGGFTFYESRPLPGAPVTGTSITQAATAVVTINSHGFSNGDRVRLYNTTGMLQIAGMDFTVSNVTTNTFDLVGLDSSGFATAATAVTARLLPAKTEVEPGALFITKISKALQAVVTTSVAHNFVVNQVLTLQVPPSMGMVEMSNLSGQVVAVTAYTVTLDINSSGFSTFVFPASAAKGAFATINPYGQENSYNVDEVPYHTGQFYPYMNLKAGANSPAGVTNDVIVWQSWKSET
jgi:hypothetical protein